MRLQQRREQRRGLATKQSHRRLSLESLETRVLLAFAPQSVLLPPTPVANAEFGAAVDVDGDVVVVGAPGEGAQGTGAVYVFSRQDQGTASQTDDTWQFMARLTSASAAAGDRFGAAVAVNMQTATIVAGSPGSDVFSGGHLVADAGSVSVFQFVPNANGGSFIETILTLGSNAAAGDAFGTSLSLFAGDTLVVGAPRRDAGALADAGAAFIFGQTTGNWSLNATLSAAASAEAGAGFGSSVALGQGQAIVGAPSEDAGGVDRGAFYRFAQSQGAWVAGTRHTGPTVVDNESSANPKPVLWVPSDGDRFGYAVAEDQGIVIVGGPGSASAGIGSAHVYADLGGGFGHVYSPKVPPIPPGSHFGAAVATAVHSFTQDGPDITFVMGAPDIQFSAGFAPGAAQILRTTEQEQGVMPDDGGNGDRLGAAIAISGFTIAFGAPGHSAGGAAGQGRVIVYGTATPPPPPTPMDFGDLGWPYTAALHDDGPRHVIGSLFLGATVDADADGQYNYQTSDASGTGDDTSGSDDEDGIVFPAIPVVGRSVTVEVTASADGKLDAWMDFSGENDGSDPNAGKFTADERILASVPVTAGKNALTFTIPSTARPNWDGTMAARFRLSSAGNLGPNGLAADGEVEDYRVAVHQLPTGAVKISSGTPSILLPRARLSLDLSDSRSRNANEKFARYEWDLDNDGQYDDSTTVPQQGRPYIDSQVSFAYSQFADLGLGLGVHTVGVRLVTDLGYSATASTTFTMDTGPFDIFLRNTGGDYLIKRDGDYVVFSDPNVAGSERRWLRTTLTALYFSGGNGNDTLTIDLSNGDPIPPQGLRFDGNGSGDFDTLVIKGGNVDTMRHDFTGPDSGWINTGGGAIRYTTIEPVETTGTTNNLVLTLPVNARPFGPVYWVPGGNTAEPDGYAYSVSPVNGGANAGGQVGRGSGQTLTHDIIDPSQLDATTYWGLTNSVLSTTAWGFDTGIGLSGVGQMSSKDGNGKFRSKFDSSRLNAAESNFSGGYAQWNLDAIPFDATGDSGPGTAGNTPTAYLPARLRLWVTTTSDSPLALQAPPAEILNSIGAVLKVTQDFKARLLMEVYAGGMWQPALSYYDAASTADGGAITTYNTGFWVEKGIMYLEDASGDGNTRLRSRENAVEVHTFTNPTDSITITARGGQDVQLVSVDPAFSPGLIVLQGTATDRFLMANSNVLPDTALVFLASGYFSLAGRSESVAAFAADVGTTIDIAGGTLGVGGVNADFEIAGVLAGSAGTVTKSGTGVMTLSGANTFLGGVSVVGGSLALTGSLADGAAVNDVTIGGAATLAGTGTLNGGVLVSGVISPGLGGAGALTVGDNLTLQTGARFAVDVAGLQAGSGYDQLRVVGAGRSVSLNGATLDVTVGNGFTPARGSSFTIIDLQDASSGVSGTFKDGSGNSLLQGSAVTIGGLKYVISYAGGTGNDVVLLRESIPSDISLSPASILENAAANTVVGTLATTDADSGDTFAYTLVSGAGDTNNAAFSISGNTVVAKNTFDYETKSSYSIRVRSTDASGLYVEKALTIQVVDVVEDAVFSPPAGQTVTDPDSHSGAIKIINRGLGTLILDKPNTHTGGVVVEAGEIIVKHPAALGTGALDIRSGAKVTFDVHDSVISLGGLVFVTGAWIDFGFARITLQAGGYSLPVLLGLLQSGYATGWTGGPGLTSRTAASIAGGGLGCFIDVDSSMMMGFAATGDTNLDGTVDILDVSATVASNKFNTSIAATWSEGDFNYDFVIDILDISDVLGAALFNSGPYVPARSPQAQSVSQSGTGDEAVTSAAASWSSISPYSWAAYGSDDASARPVRKTSTRKLA